MIDRKRPIPAPIPSFKLLGIEFMIQALIGVRDINRNNIPANKTVANALVDYPIINGKAFIMISSYGSTGLRINEIGKKTVNAWKTVYKNWNEEKDSINKKLLYEY